MFDQSISKVNQAEAIVRALGLSDLECYALGVRLSRQEED